MWLVKIGGSLACSEQLPAWLDHLRRLGAGRVVIVPGGGPFANQVRDAQQRWRFDDSPAHAMALLAMVQYGLLLSAVEPELIAANSEQAIHKALAAHRVAVWTGATAALDDTSVEASWRVSADSLTLWLAKRLGAIGVILIKSAPPPPLAYPQLAAAGYVDAAFCDFLNDYHGQVVCLGPRQQQRLMALLDKTDHTGAGAGAS